jgi:hypothetical protein
MRRRSRRPDSDDVVSLKYEATRISALLHERFDIKLGRSQVLELVARLHGFRDWNTACKASNVSIPQYDLLRTKCEAEAESLASGNHSSFTPKSAHQDSLKIAEILHRVLTYSQWTRELMADMAQRRQAAHSHAFALELIETYRQAYVDKKGIEPPLTLSLSELSLGVVDSIDNPPSRERMAAYLASQGIPDHLIYAYKKTGLMLDGDAYDNLSENEKRAYDEAVKEYFASSGESEEEYYRAVASIESDVNDDLDILASVTAGWTNARGHDFTDVSALFSDDIDDQEISDEEEIAYLESLGPVSKSPLLNRTGVLDKDTIRHEEDLLGLTPGRQYVFTDFYELAVGGVLLSQSFGDKGFLVPTVALRVIGDRIVSCLITVTATARLTSSRAALFHAGEMLKSFRVGSNYSKPPTIKSFVDTVEPFSIPIAVLSVVQNRHQEHLVNRHVSDGSFTVFFQANILPAELDDSEIDRSMLREWNKELIETTVQKRPIHSASSLFLPVFGDSFLGQLTAHRARYYADFVLSLGAYKFSDESAAISIIDMSQQVRDAYWNLSSDPIHLEKMLRTLRPKPFSDTPDIILKAYDVLFGLWSTLANHGFDMDPCIHAFRVSNDQIADVTKLELDSQESLDRAPLYIEQFLKTHDVVGLLSEAWSTDELNVNPSKSKRRKEVASFQIYSADGRRFIALCPIDPETRGIQKAELLEPDAVHGRMVPSKSLYGPL